MCSEVEWEDRSVGEIKSHVDGATLFYREWAPKSDKKEAVVLLMHGIYEHWCEQARVG